MTAIRYFAYGSNMLTAWLQSRCKSARATGVASVAGYRLAFTKRSKDGSGKAMLVASDPAARVYGVLYDIDGDEIEALDRSEGRGNGYERVEDFEVRANGNAVRAMTYMADKTAIDAALKPYDWYLDLAVKGAEQNGLPGDYYRRLALLPCQPDPVLDRQTRLDAMAMLSRMERKGLPLRSRANVRIAGDRTVGDWATMRAVLKAGSDPAPWSEAFRDFFCERLETRYFAPIRAINGIRRHTGEGFAIVAIQCSLIEFLGATLKGEHYRHPSEGELQDHEYADSKKMFVSFLTEAVPFKSVFTSKARAKKFYTAARCGLLHEARTKNGWTIRSPKASGPFVDLDAKIIYRNDLQRAFEEFLGWYGSELLKNKDYQEAFIRKFDGICAD